mgnify:CR=1 FL=1
MSRSWERATDASHGSRLRSRSSRTTRPAGSSKTAPFPPGHGRTARDSILPEEHKLVAAATTLCAIGGSSWLLQPGLFPPQSGLSFLLIPAAGSTLVFRCEKSPWSSSRTRTATLQVCDGRVRPYWHCKRRPKREFLPPYPRDGRVQYPDLRDLLTATSSTCSRTRTCAPCMRSESPSCSATCSSSVASEAISCESTISPTFSSFFGGRLLFPSHFSASPFWSTVQSSSLGPSRAAGLSAVVITSFPNERSDQFRPFSDSFRVPSRFAYVLTTRRFRGGASVTA